MINIALCDDNSVQLNYTKEVIRRELAPRLTEIECFSSTDKLLKSMSLGDYRPDIAVLDIELDDEDTDGISFARELNRLLPDCRIIFLTAYLSYASEAYEAEHDWFVAKVEMEKYLPKALNRAIQQIETKQKKEIPIRIQRKTTPIPMDDVLYIERFHYKTKLVSSNQEWITNQTPSELLGDSMADEFVRCHQGYWVNREHIVALERDEFVMRNDKRIAISRTFRDRARTAFFERFK